MKKNYTRPDAETLDFKTNGIMEGVGGDIIIGISDEAKGDLE
jgi:hypothetical protein